MHPAWTFMLRDIGGSVVGILLFCFGLLAPGFAVAQLTDICKFRSRTSSEQLAWSVVLSFAVGTLFTVGAVWVAGVTGGACALFAFGTCSAFLFFRRRASSLGEWREALPYVGLALFVCITVIFSLVDVGIHDRLYMSVTVYDNALRTAFVDSVLRKGVPPANPVYWPGHDAPLRYYYFWYVLCAAVAKLGQISPRQALIASSVWSVFGLIASLALFSRYVLEWRGAELRRRWWTAVGLLAVTGLDGLIALIAYLGTGVVARDIEWWSLDQVSSWADTFLWVPHHAAALVCSVLCILLVRIATSQTDQHSPWGIGILAGLSFASSFGLSTYIAIATALLLTGWFLANIVRRERVQSIRMYAALSVSAAICLGPYLTQLLRPQRGARVQAGSVLQFGLRELLPPAVLGSVPGIQTIADSHPHLANEISAALLLLPSYFLELGFFGLALIVLQRRNEKTSGEKALLFLSWGGLVVVSVFRSGVIAMNDYAVRASLIPQFCLLFAGVLAVERSKHLTRIVLFSLLVIGLTGSVYQVVLLRTYLPLHDRPSDPEYLGLAHQNFVLREAYSEMREKIPANARVQFSIPNAPYTGLAQQINLGRQMVVDSERCNDSFGGEQAPCSSIEASLAQLFSQSKLLSAGESVALCRAAGADYLSAADWDPAWKQKASWVWTLPVVVARPEIRVLSCTLPLSAK